MARYLVLLLFIFSGFMVSSQPLNLDVKHYDISVDTIDFGNQTIKAHVAIDLHATNQLDNIQLSLLRFTIDSIIENGQALAYNYDDTTITINLTQALNSGDSTQVTVYYHGHPQEDNSGFGGFSFQGSTYAFNIGVGFEANPHTYGRVWFPCVDNFTDRATYGFHIRVLNNYKAMCNGELASVIANGDATYTYNWEMHNAIPTYLAGMAVAPFYIIQRIYHNIPVSIAVLPNDTINTLSTFQNLENCVGTYVDRYGPYQWNKIGYVAVPFTAGAMEHSTSIHIGKVFINGTLNYQTLWAHELAHQWWGDLVTCERQEEMWLNEGFASYSEAIFLEGLNGQDSYKNYVRNNHRKVLQFHHIIDDGYRPLNDIPHEYTYSTTVYDKGADIAHTLRGFMGDSAFFNGCKHYFNTMAYQSASSEDLRDALEASSGIDMDRFFEDWIFTGGFPHFSVDSFTVSPEPSSTYLVTIYTKQKQKGNNHIYEMPLEFTFRDGTNETTEVFTINATNNTFQTSLNFSPTMVTIDKEEKISDAISDFETKLFTLGDVDLKETNASITITNGGNDSSLIRIEHNWVAPDDFINPLSGIVLSDYHYYTVDGIFPDGFQAKLTLNFNGSTSQSVGYLDNNLITGKEDSLVLLYREGTGDNWQIASNYSINYQGSHSDKRGKFEIEELRKGQYTFGYKDTGSGSRTKPVKKNDSLVVFPNPSDNSCTIKFSAVDSHSAKIIIMDQLGKTVFEQQINHNANHIIWKHRGLPPGTYLINLADEKTLIGTASIIIK